MLYVSLSLSRQIVRKRDYKKRLLLFSGGLKAVLKVLSFVQNGHHLIHLLIMQSSIMRAPALGCNLTSSPAKEQLFAGFYATGSRLDKTVGRNSATVGWICIARCTKVYGAFAYMTSSKT